MILINIPPNQHLNIIRSRVTTSKHIFFIYNIDPLGYFPSIVLWAMSIYEKCSFMNVAERILLLHFVIYFCVYIWKFRHVNIERSSAWLICCSLRASWVEACVFVHKIIEPRSNIQLVHFTASRSFEKNLNIGYYDLMVLYSFYVLFVLFRWSLHRQFTYVFINSVVCVMKPERQQISASIEQTRNRIQEFFKHDLCDAMKCVHIRNRFENFKRTKHANRMISKWSDQIKCALPLVIVSFLFFDIFPMHILLLFVVLLFL